MSVAHLISWESGSSWFSLSSHLVLNFEACLEKIFKQLRLLRFPVKCWHRCVVVSDFGNLETLLILFWKISELLVCQLLKGQQQFVCFDRRRGVLSAELRLTDRAVFLLSWRCFGGAVCNFFVNSWQNVKAVFWEKISCDLALKEGRFWMRITWELSSFIPWFVPYALWDVSGALPDWPWNSGFMRKTSRRDNTPDIGFSVLLSSKDNFLVTLPSISLETWVM